MRIAFVSDAAFPWHMGGIEAVERVEAEELAKSHDVEFYSMRWPGMRKEFADAGIKYHTLGKTDQHKFYRHGTRSIRQAIKFAISTFNVFNGRYDVIECNMFPILHIPVLKLYCMLFRCKLVLDVVEIWDSNYWQEYLKNPFFAMLGGAFASVFVKMGDAYIANSSATAKKLFNLGIQRHKVDIFAPILNDKEMEPFMVKRKKSNTVVYWGRLIKEKRLDKWIGVIRDAHLMAKNVHGLIIGDGPEERSLKEMIDREGLAKVIDVLPAIPGREPLWKKVCGCAVLMHMSEREGLGLVILESLALGIPAMLPSYTPVPEEVKAMCVVEDEKNMAGKLVEILKSRKREGYIRNAQNLEEFKISKVLDFYNGLFKKLGLSL